MAPKKGITNNPNGRPKGSKNKVTKDIRGKITGFLEENMDKFLKDLLLIKCPKDRLLLVEKLLQYTTPRMQSIDQTTVGKIEIEDKFKDVSDQQLQSIINDLLKTQF